MKEYKEKHLMIRVPKNIDYERLFSNFELKVQKYKTGTVTETELNNIKDSIILMLHFLIPDSTYLEENSKHHYYKRINSVIFNHITGKKLKIVKDILLDDDYPLITSDNRYHNSKSYGFKLRDEFFFSDTIKYKSEGKIISKYYASINKESSEMSTDYKFLTERLNKRISFDPLVDEYISQLFSTFEKKVKDLSETEYNINELRYNIEMLKFRMTTGIKEIKRGEFNPKTSKTCLRFSSVFTNLKRELRYFITIDGEETEEVDMTSSQPYCLATILNSDFYQNVGNGFNLINVFPELYNDLLKCKTNIKIDTYNLNYLFNHNQFLSTNKLKYISKNNLQLNLPQTSINNFLTSNNNFKSITSSNNIKYYLYKDIKLLIKRGIPPLPYMCGKIEETPEIKEFLRLGFDKDFYSSLSFLLTGNRNRQNIKDNMMYYLFMTGDRNKSYFNNEIRRIFPNLNCIIEMFLRYIKINDVSFKNKNVFALLLQRVESFLFLKNGVKNYCLENNMEPLITIHDSVLVKKKSTQTMIESIRNSIEKVTNIKVGLKIKNINPFLNIQEFVDEFIDSYKCGSIKTYIK